MDKKSNILLTNDDGFNAEGLKKIYEILQDQYQITIVAPAQEQSGSGLSITFKDPIRYHEVTWENGIHAWGVYGTPADCVNLAFKVILDSKPVLVISGINNGSNAGRSVLYSGTLGAAIESVMQGVPSIAFSYADSKHSDHYDTYISLIVDYFIKNLPPKGTCINVNIPSSPIKGCRMTQQGKGLWTDDLKIESHVEKGFVANLINGRFIHINEDSESDVVLLSKGYITATPIDIFDLTNFEHISKHQKKFEEILI
ncbi:hypothetical protein LCGC14_1635640 [marine sediment metagenome]|uniref:Survival protein SurE-like phosphatase/nucleotidase domain-containing protein n=1 Tax=marine sediment metagenome TaxID=412755 RepID=A0A0F9L0R1_9ZZZZ